MSSFSFTGHKCVEYTVIRLVIDLVARLFRAMYTGTFFVQCDIIVGVSSVDEKPVVSAFFRSVHPPAVPNNAQAVTLLY